MYEGESGFAIDCLMVYLFIGEEKSLAMRVELPDTVCTSQLCVIIFKDGIMCIFSTEQPCIISTCSFCLNLFM